MIYLDANVIIRLASNGGLAVARVALSNDLAAYIAERINRFATEAPTGSKWQSPFVAKFAALPLYSGWSDTIGIRCDGELISWSTEREYSGTRPVEGRTWTISALVAGVEKYPELRALLPDRPLNATDCSCRNHSLFAPGKIMCGACGGIGWLPATH